MEPEDLFRLRLVGETQVAPDGVRIAYVVRYLDQDSDEYVSNIYLWDGAESRQFTAGGKDSTPRWSPDGKRLAFLRRDEKNQIYLMPADGGEAIRLTNLPLGAGAPVWSPDSSAIAFSHPVATVEIDEDKPRIRVIDRAVYKQDGVGPTDHRYLHISIVDLEGDCRQLTSGDFDHTDPAWSPDGRHLAFVADRDLEWDLRMASDIWLVPREGGEPRRVTDGSGQWASPAFSPDGSRLAFVGHPEPPEGRPAPYTQLWVIDRAGRDQCNLLAGTDLAVGDTLIADWSNAGSGGPYWREDGIYFLASECGTTNIYRWHDGLQPVTRGRHHVMDFSVAGGTTACTVSHATQPAEIALVRDGEFDVITAHNKGLAEGLVAPRELRFAGADGAEIEGWLLEPVNRQSGRRYPLIVYIHGGPFTAYGETFFHEFQTLAAAGFGVFYCNPHGSTSYGADHQLSILGDWGNRDYADVMAGVDRVLAEDWVDPRRLGVAGGSYGGFLTNWIISHTDRFAAAVTQRSICNMVSQGGTSDWAAGRGRRLLATPEADPERLWEMSPLRYVSNVHTPTLILHSERDDRCPIEQGEQWFAALKRLRVPVRFVRFPEESHGLSRAGKPSRRQARLEHILDWFRTYL